MNIRTKIVLSNSLAAFVPLAIFAAISLLNQIGQLENQHEIDTRRKLLTIDARMQTFVKSIEADVTYLASFGHFERVDESASSFLGDELKLTDSESAGGVESEIYASYSNFKSMRPYLVDIYFGTRFGGLISTTKEYLRNYDTRVRPWYRSAVAEPGRVVMSPAYVGTIGEAMVSMAKVVRRSDGSIIGVQSVDVTLRTLTEMINDSGAEIEGYMMLIDGDGTVLADPSNIDNLFKKTLELDQPILNAISRTRSANLTVDSGIGSYEVAVYFSDRLGWKIVAVTNSDTVYAPAYALAEDIGTTAVFIFLLSLIVAGLSTRSITAPIQRLAEAMKSIANGDPEEVKPISGTGNDEIGNLANSFNQFLERQNAKRGEALHAQKMEAVGQLAAGIAHEINTPTQFIGDNVRFLDDAFNDMRELLDAYGHFTALAPNDPAREGNLDSLHGIVKRIDLEYLLNEVPSAISQAADGTDRIATIIRAMKEFSHPGAESSQPEDLNKAIQNTTVVARSEWKYCSNLVLELDPDLPLVACFLGDINQAVLNIVVNAAHAIADKNAAAGDGSLGTITIGTKIKDGFAVISIADNGGGMPPEVMEKIFDPFFTTKEVGKGTGQGLSIAYRSVVNKHHGKLEVRSQPGEGTTFLIKLPHPAEGDAQKVA